MRILEMKFGGGQVTSETLTEISTKSPPKPQAVSTVTEGTDMGDGHIYEKSISHGEIIVVNTAYNLTTVYSQAYKMKVMLWP